MRTTTHPSLGGSKLGIVEASLDEFVRVYDRPFPAQSPQAEHTSRHHHDAAWYAGLKTTDAASELLTNGWAEGARRVSDLARQTTEVPAAKSRRRVGRWSDDGESLDVDRALAGEWDTAYRTHKREVTEGPQTIRLNVPFGGINYETNEQLFWRGAVGVVLADILESAGYAVEIVAYEANYNTTLEMDVGVTMVRVKESDEPLRIDALAGVVCHSGVARLNGFRLQDESPIGYEICQGYWKHNPRLKVLERMTQAGEWTDSDLVCRPVGDRDGAIAEINRALNTLQRKEG